MTSEEKAEMAAAIRRIARDSFGVGFVLGRQLLADQLHKREVLDEDMEKKSAEIMFAFYEHKLLKIYGERN